MLLLLCESRRRSSGGNSNNITPTSMYNVGCIKEFEDLTGVVMLVLFLWLSGNIMPPSSVLKIETVVLPEPLASIDETTRPQNPEE